MDSKGITFVILKDHTSVPIRRERLSPMSKARREVSRNKFVKNGGMPDRVKSFREIDSRQNRPTAQPGFVKPIRNGLRKAINVVGDWAESLYARLVPNGLPLIPCLILDFNSKPHLSKKEKGWD